MPPHPSSSTAYGYVPQQPVYPQQQQQQPYGQAPQQQHQQQQQSQQQYTSPSPTTAVAADNKSFDTQHSDLIHDAQFDYYGRRLATGSSDRTVKVFLVELEQIKGLQATLTGHEGPVWMVSWAHPQFGSILASCSFDGSVIIWKEVSQSNWQKIKEHRVQDGSSVNAISWAPYECGLKLACASSDGRVSVLTCQLDGQQQGEWDCVEFHAHAVGCNAVSWAPVTPASIIGQASATAAHFTLVTGGCDNLIRIWAWNESDQAFSQEHSLDGHSDWVRDVHFSPSDPHTLASCSQDKTVRIWKEVDGQWTSQPLSKDPFSDSIWRVSFSLTGTTLSVCAGDDKITLWKEDGTGSWELTKAIGH